MVAPLQTGSRHKNMKSEIKSYNSKFGSFKFDQQQSKYETITMRLRSRDFQDSPMENISTSLDESYRNSPRASGGPDHQRDSNKTLSHFSHFKQSASTFNPRLPHGRIRTSKMNNYFQNNASGAGFEIP